MMGLEAEISRLSRELGEALLARGRAEGNAKARKKGKGQGNERKGKHAERG